ncbi:LLM class flavin-dependent oxidoreductase [Microbacterium marinilacus]|uniref:LLM class flavin-dependent oxidoreductase n=1 Tax=Microbacterium marinilacus TaxID=415209 RepID=A0ABP7BWL6_9MICO|nr:LLM class flavin-dependent oxidoreductase [Microbacterium marinilacus]MBY0688151.1 LLM class flavin-dependent oxidoreductase [Microbacterium marinilacus]
MTHAVTPDVAPPVVGVSLSDDVALDAVRDDPPAALGDVVGSTAAGILHLGGDRFRPPRDGAARLDPLFAAQRLLARLPDAAALIAAGPDVEHPYNLARRAATLDLFTAGRIGIVVGARDRRGAPGGRRSTPWSDAPIGPELAAEFAEVLRELWNSWPRDAIVADKEAGVFSDSSRILRVHHRGAYDVAGPLGTPSSVQGEPVLGWRADFHDGADEPVAPAAELLITEAGADTHADAHAGGAGDAVPRIAEVGVDDLEAWRSTPPAGFSGALVRVDATQQLPAVVAALAAHGAAAAPVARGTLRERLGLAPRSLRLERFTPAFPNKALS